MALTSGMQLGPYEIQSPLGAGGRTGEHRGRHPERGHGAGTAGGKSLANTGFIDITRDGQRILLSQPQPNANAALTLVLNWADLLKK